jgi:hypothetical protein
VCECAAAGHGCSAPGKFNLESIQSTAKPALKDAARREIEGRHATPENAILIDGICRHSTDCVCFLLERNIFIQVDKKLRRMLLLSFLCADVMVNFT